MTTAMGHELAVNQTVMGKAEVAYRFHSIGLSPISFARRHSYISATPRNRISGSDRVRRRPAKRRLCFLAFVANRPAFD